MVRVKLLLLDENARKIMGEKEVMLEIPKDKATVRDLLREIAAKYGGRILNVISKPNISTLLNGQYIEFLKGVNANLSDGDRVAVISIAAGG